MKLSEQLEIEIKRRIAKLKLDLHNATIKGGSEARAKVLDANLNPTKHKFSFVNGKFVSMETRGGKWVEVDYSP